MALKTFIKLATFIVFLIGGWTYLEAVFMPSHDYNTTRAEFETVTKNTNVDVLFLGSSHMYASINPYVIDKKCKTVSFNLGSATMNFDFSSLVIERALEDANPKLVIIELSLGAFHKMTKKEKGFHKRLLDFSNKLTRKNAATIYSKYDFEELPSIYSYIIRNHKNWAGVSYFNLDRSRKKSHRRVFRHNGYIGARDSLPADIQDKYKDFRTYKPKLDSSQVFFEQRHFDELVELKELAKKHNFELLFITAPDVRSTRINNDLYRQLQDISSEYGIRYLNLNWYYDTMDLKTNDFIDQYHLNLSGGLKASNVLSKFINKHYQLPDRSSEPYWINQMNNYGNLKQGFITGSPEKDILRDDSLFGNVRIKKISTTRFIDKYRFKVHFDSLVHDSLSNRLKLGIQVFPKSGNETQLSDRSRDLGRIFDSYSKVISDFSKPLIVEVWTKAKPIGKLRLFISDNGPYKGVKGKAINITSEEIYFQY